MGLDLALLPMKHDDPDWGFAHDVLNMQRDYDVFDKIKKLPTTPVPTKFYTYMGRGKEGEACYCDTQETPYGNPLLAVTMAQLKTVGIPGPVGAFVAASPDDQRVALYWH